MKTLKILLLLCLCSYNLYAQTNQSCNDFLFNDLKNKQLNLNISGLTTTIAKQIKKVFFRHLSE